MREVFLLVGRGGAVLWSDASESMSALPDSRSRWEAIWWHRNELELLVHSHPIGPHAFSAEDESTMAAVEEALGKKVSWGVLSPGGVLVRDAGGQRTLEHAPWWAGLLRAASGMR